MADDDDDERGPFNHDIKPLKKLSKKYPRFKGLITNMAIVRQFTVYEDAANSWKRIYNFLGKGGLVCIFLVMAALDCRLVLHTTVLDDPWISFALALLAVIGLVMELALIFQGIKEKWLVNRYAAERVRCLKFQTFLLAGQHAVTDLTAAVDDYTEKNLVLIEESMDTAMDNFNPKLVMFPPDGSLAGWNEQDRRDFIAIHDSLRFGWQEAHFKKLAKSLGRKERLPASLGGMVFIVGGFLALGELATSFPWPVLQVSPVAHAWLNFSTLLTFILSATIAIWERGDAKRPHKDRYRRYAAEVGRLRERLRHQTPAHVLSVMAEMEREELQELHDFLRDVHHSSYIF